MYHPYGVIRAVASAVVRGDALLPCLRLADTNQERLRFDSSIQECGIPFGGLGFQHLLIIQSV